jgi:threonine dehydrogenase-like Zn-dependent dehydrogenase
MGCYSTTDKSFSQALQLINAGKIATEELISHRFSLRELPHALRLQGKGQGLKKMIVFD